jgi:hypothetical protein
MWKVEPMNEKITLSNPYKIAALATAGIRGVPVQDHGYIAWTYEASPTVQAAIDGFDEDQLVNLRVYVEHLRRIQDEIRMWKGERGNRNA